jgi:hypothetical protein
MRHSDLLLLFKTSMVEFRGIPPLPQKQIRGKDGAPAVYSLAGIHLAKAVPFQNYALDDGTTC